VGKDSSIVEAVKNTAEAKVLSEKMAAIMRKLVGHPKFGPVKVIDGISRYLRTAMGLLSAAQETGVEFSPGPALRYFIAAVEEGLLEEVLLAILTSDKVDEDGKITAALQHQTTISLLEITYVAMTPMSDEEVKKLFETMEDEHE